MNIPIDQIFPNVMLVNVGPTSFALDTAVFVRMCTNMFENGKNKDFRYRKQFKVAWDSYKSYLTEDQGAYYH